MKEHDLTTFDDHDKTFDGFASNPERCVCKQSHSCSNKPEHKVITDREKPQNNKKVKEIDYVCEEHAEMVIEAEKEEIE